jgi:hypothetical protein
MVPHFIVTGCEAHTNSADETACLRANYVQDEVVKIQRSQEVLKMLSIYMYTFLLPNKDILNHLLKLFCRNISNFPMKSLFPFSFSYIWGLLLQPLIFQRIPKEKNHKD